MTTQTLSAIPPACLVFGCATAPAVSIESTSGPATNDLALQLRKRGIDRVVLAGMSANLCTESHMRELIEQGFEITVVSEGMTGAVTPELGDGYAAALTNFKFIANAVVRTDAVVAAMDAGSN